MNSLPLTFHRDKEGAARAVWSGGDAAGNLLAQFFEAELGADAAYCDRFQSEAERMPRPRPAMEHERQFVRRS